MIGQSLRRLEDARFLTGQGRYIADLIPPDALHLHVLRSPHAHATILQINTTPARAQPGLIAILLAQDLAELGPIPCSTAVPTLEPMRIPPYHALASDRVRYVGQPVAFVIAETARAAQDAAEAIEIDYDPLPCITEAEQALQPGAPQLHQDIPNNLSFRFQKGNPAAVAAAMATAAHIATVHLVNNRVIVAPLEHRGAIGRVEAGTLHLLVSGQGVHGLRQDLARSVFNLPEPQIQVACPDVGGGFGVKNPLYPEYIAVLYAARRFNRPVAWLSGHAEDFVSTAHGRDNVTTARLALDNTGRFLALDVETTANLGAYLSTGGPGSSTNAPGNAMGCGYVIPAIAMNVRGAFTNTVPLDAYRGAGKPEANYLLERLIDQAATQLGTDRTALRRRNLIQTFPHPTPMNTTIDGGRFAQNIDPALLAADTAGFPARRTASAQQNRLRGLGITCFLETARGAPNEGAEIRFAPNGRVSLHLGTQSNGQGHETTFPQIAAARLGLPIEQFDFIQADTTQVRDGHGHGGARSLHMGGSALMDAINLVLEKARPVAARLLQARPHELTFNAGHFTAGDRSVPLPEVARAAERAGEGLDAYHWTLLDRITFPNGVHIAEIELDRETGALHLLRYTAVDDFGTAINPLLLIGQVQGGVAQGIGQALMERTVYDETGQLLSGSFMDYAIPRAADLPDLSIFLQGEPTTANPLGVKGAGQAGAIAAPPVITAAVLDALTPLGIHHIDMPITPERLWRAMQYPAATTPNTLV